MYAEERQNAIAQLVADDGRASVTELARQFDVTTETVRRDLASLERLKIVRRVHGGAVPATMLSAAETAVTDREMSRRAQKRAIGAAAQQFLPAAGGSAIFDAGTTTAAAARHVTPRSFAAVTNSLPVAATLSAVPDVDIQLLGGRIRGITQAAVGPTTIDALRRIRVDIAFVGTNGVDLEFGLSTPDPDEAAVKSAIIDSAAYVVLLCDSSKFDQRSMVSFAGLDLIDAVVTDDGVTDADRAALTERGIEVVVA
jgi:DeoR family fructose operon transcriptional repressor